jgi:two-component system sensor histidine kinase/response regulator
LKLAKWRLKSSILTSLKQYEGTLEVMAESAFGKGIELACEIATGVNQRLRGDPGRLRQLLTNLIGNAIEFTSQGEVLLP